MDDDAKTTTDVISMIISNVLDSVTISLAAARCEVRTNPQARPEEFRGDKNFAEAADFGLFVAQAIIEKINARFRDEQRTLN